MPRPGPRRPQVAVRLDTGTLAKLDALAQHWDVTRSDIIRDAVSAYLLTRKP